MVNKNNVDRFNGFADSYDKFRPVPPEIIPEILINYRGKKPSLVVDLGCGTGLSTFIWKDRSDNIIGIDPNKDMLKKAKEKLDSKDDNIIEFRFGYSNDTKLKENCADIITCSSAFQWMEPESTIKEMLRILKDGGVFAMYNHGQPSAIDWGVEKAYMDLFRKVYQILDDSRGEEGREKLYTNNEYLNTMKKSNGFRFMKEILVHKKVEMNSDRLIGFALSQGALQEVIKRDIPSMNIEIEKFTDVVSERLGDRVFDGVFSYGMRLAVK